MKGSFPVTLEEWNAQLVRIVFFESFHMGSTLSRIDTTGRIFEQLAGSRSNDDAKQSFIASFGKNASKIQAALRDESRLDILAQKKGYPTYFAILYLTLLAASADDETHEEGDFRVRFSLLLGFDKNKQFIFSELPNLWERLEKWSNTKQNCTRLVLPNHSKKERLIGYSKRIAFPCYKDEVFLRNILTKNRLDNYSSFEVVNKIVHQSISNFGEVFKQEFFEFRTLLLNAVMQQVYDSPFWGAVRDITLCTENEQIKQNGKYCLHLDLCDVDNPEIYLLMDDKAVLSSGIHNYYSLSNEIENYNNLYSEKDITSTLNALTLLLKKGESSLCNSRIGKAIQSGCILLFRDNLGHISSDGEYYDDSPFYLILHHEYAINVQSVLKSLGKKLHIKDINSIEWAVIFFDKINRQILEKIIDLLPKKNRQFLMQGWKPVRPYISRMAQFGQAILLNPASTPIINISGVSNGRFIISNKDGLELIQGELSRCSEGLFIHPEKLMKLSTQAFCRYELKLAESDLPVIFDIHVLDHAPYMDYRKITEPYDWLVDGPAGVLISLRDTTIIPSLPLKHKKTIPLNGSQMLWSYEKSFQATCIHTELHNIPAAFDWIAEALALRFQRRSTLPFGELKQHIELVSHATDIPTWKLLRALFAAGWIVEVQRRHAPYSLVSLAERTISIDVTEQCVVARIMGMFTRSERNLLQERLQIGEQIDRWVIEDDCRSIGYIKLYLSDRGRIDAFIELFGLRLINEDDFPLNPLSGVVLPLSQIQSIPVLPSDLYASFWQAETYQWSKELRLTQKANKLLMRCKEKQRYRYFIRHNNGYWQTDSVIWAQMAQVISSGGVLGIRKGDSDWIWSEKIIALPLSVLQWWVHIANGCLSITDKGSFLFVGGKVPLWSNMTELSTSQQALTRRKRALEMRKIL